MSFENYVPAQDGVAHWAGRRPTNGKAERPVDSPAGQCLGCWLVLGGGLLGVSERPDWRNCMDALDENREWV